MDSPLQQPQLDKINDTLHTLSLLIPEIERAMRAGIDVSRQQAAAAYYRQRLLTIKGQYFPGQP